MSETRCPKIDAQHNLLIGVKDVTVCAGGAMCVKHLVNGRVRAIAGAGFLVGVVLPCVVAPSASRDYAGEPSLRRFPKEIAK